ncbi:MAG: site-specific DNA-methyltransferase [Myxococcota bacterium]
MSGRPQLLEGDNLTLLRQLIRAEVRAHLIYLDPPFFTQRLHHRVRRKRGRQGSIERTEHVAFDDRWQDLDHYLSELRERLRCTRDLLHPCGSIVIHVDPTTSHYVKVMADEVFGRSAFASEIVWRYRRWPAKTRNFQRMHDTLLRYVADPDAEPRFNQLYEPLAASTLATWGRNKQRAKVDGRGRRVRSTTTNEKSPGTPMGDVWEIGVIAPVANERTGYPTQKPLALLRRLITALSDPGDLVLDPYVGSGTTMVAALELGRQAIGLDRSSEALDVCRERLEPWLGAGPPSKPAKIG